MPGRLFVVTMPIGNPDDLSYRAVRILGDVSAVVAEDPAVAKTVLQHHRLATPITSYHAPDLREKIRVLVSRLDQGADLALVSDAGMPTVADPGHRLVKAALRAGIPVVAVPGPTAAVAALPLCQFPWSAFCFHGSVPAAAPARRRLLRSLRRRAEAAVFFESAGRLTRFLQDARTILGNRQALIAEELTSTAERVIRARLGSLPGMLGEQPPKGAITVIIQGRTAGRAPEPGKERRRRGAQPRRRFSMVTR